MPSHWAAAFTEKYPGTFKGLVSAAEDMLCGILDPF
jgi:hypothetical protein